MAAPIIKKQQSSFRGWTSVLLLIAFSFGSLAAVTSRREISAPPVPVPESCSLALQSLETNGVFEQGLAGFEIPASLVGEFVLKSVNCVGRGTLEGEVIRGLFVELADQDGQAAIYASITSDESIADWSTYLQETFSTLDLDFDTVGGRELLALVVDHPRSDVVRAAFRQRSDGPTLAELPGGINR